MTGADSPEDAPQCPYEGCENTATGIYTGDGVQFPECDDCAPPHPPVREFEVDDAG